MPTGEGRDDPDSPTATGRSSLLASRPALTAVWGLLGALSFLVLLQAYELIAGVRVTLVAKLGVAVAVAVVTTAAAVVFQRRLPAGNERS